MELAGQKPATLSVGGPARPDASKISLVEAARRGSEEATAALVRAHWAGAYRAAYLILGDRDEAEDAVQEAFISALGDLDSFDPTRPLEPWLYRIVVNRATDRARSLSRRNRRDSLIAEQVDRAGPSAAPQISDPALAEAISRLPLEQRTVVVMRFVLDFSDQQIAEMLAVPRGTVGSRTRRGLDALRDQLGEEER